MANHGHCKDCWWYEVTNKPCSLVIKGALVEKEGNGNCYMNKGDNEQFTEVKDSSYCLDYCNREKEEKINGILADWKKLHRIN